MKITVTRPSMPALEEFESALKPIFESKWLTNMGPVHQKLEKSLQDYLEVPYVSLMVNGHTALEMAIQAMDFPEGSEVITTPFTFISTTHAIVRNRLKPVFCDIKLSDYTIDENKIEELITDKTVAILPVHVYGNICNTERIQEIADRHGLKVIYDACHAFGERVNGESVANFGDASVFSFHATKVYNTIEGGAVTFSEQSLYERLYNLKNFGIRGEELIADIGANAKMNEVCAAMGLCNLPYVEKNRALRKERAEWYISRLREEHMRLPDYTNLEISYNYGYFPVCFADEEMRNRIYQRLQEQDIYSRKYFYPLTSDAACFQGKYKELKLEQARKTAKTILVLPLYPELEYADMERICSVISHTLRE